MTVQQEHHRILSRTQDATSENTGPDGMLFAIMGLISHPAGSASSPQFVGNSLIRGSDDE